jgi:hypothetical protein
LCSSKGVLIKKKYKFSFCLKWNYNIEEREDGDHITVEEYHFRSLF